MKGGRRPTRTTGRKVFRACGEVWVLVGALMAVCVLLLSSPPVSGADRWSSAFMDYVHAAPGSAGLAVADREAVRAVYGRLPVEVSVQDFDGDGDPEYVVRHLRGCGTVATRADRGAIAVCAWTVIDRVEKNMTVVLSASGWRSRGIVSGGRIIGIDLDGMRWVGSADHPGRMLAVGEALSWSKVEPGEMLEDLEDRFGPVHDFHVAALEVAGREVAVVHDREGGSRATWVLLHEGRLLKAGEAAGSPVAAVSATGILRLNDSRTGRELVSVSFPLTEGGWWHLWDRPRMPPGWMPLAVRAEARTAADAEGLWDRTELDEAEGRARLYRASMVLPEGRRLVLSWLSGNCGRTQCPVRGRIGSDGKTSDILFDGRRTGQTCIADPHSMAVAAAGASIRLKACNRTLVLEEAEER